MAATRLDSPSTLAASSSSLPMLDIRTRRAPRADRWHASVALKRDRLYAGPVRGYIFVQTSDPDYPIVSVPVVGEVVAR